MFNGVLKNLLTSGGDDVVRNLATNYGDDVARSIGSKATNVLDDLLPATAKKTATKTATKKLSSVSDDAISAAKKYIDAPTADLSTATTKSTTKLATPDIEHLMDRYGIPYQSGDVPVTGLTRRSEFQPRTTASGKGTENSVFTKGYNEGAVDQPMLVRKVGDSYEVLGGHSRTLGMERRAAEGLPNPESIKARIYENISDEQARQISRAANQGGQYESTLDMAKSISDSMTEGLTPSVQKQNMSRGYSYDDYKYLWDTVSGDNILRDKLFQGAIPQDDVLAIARHARTKGLDADKTMGVIRSLDANGTLDKRNAKNVVNLLTGKIKAGLNQNVQTGLFGDIDTAVNAVDLLQDFTNTSGELNRRVNAIKTVAKEDGLSDAVLKELEGSRSTLEKKMKNISDEILDRYKARNEKLSFKASEAVADAVPEAQGGLFNTPAVAETPAPAPKTTKKKTTEIVDNLPKKINVMQINDNSTSNSVPVDVKKYLPNMPDDIVKQSTNSQVKQQRSPRKTTLQLQAIERSLPTPQDIRTMTDQQLKEFIPSWRTAMASVLGLSAIPNDEK